VTPLYCELRDLGPRRLFFPAAGGTATGDEGAGTTAPCASAGAGGPRSAAWRAHAPAASDGGDPFDAVEAAAGAAAASGYDGKGKSWRVTMGGEGEQPSSSGVPPSRSNRKKPPPTTRLELEVAEAEPAVGDSALRSSTIDSSSGPAAGDRARELPAPASSSSSLAAAAAAASGRSGRAGAAGGGGGGHGGGHPKTKGTARWDVRGANGIAGEAIFVQSFLSSSRDPRLQPGKKCYAHAAFFFLLTVPTQRIT